MSSPAECIACGAPIAGPGTVCPYCRTTVPKRYPPSYGLAAYLSVNEIRQSLHYPPIEDEWRPRQPAPTVK